MLLNFFIMYIFDIYTYSSIKTKNGGQCVSFCAVHILWPFCTVNASRTWVNVVCFSQLFFIQINQLTNCTLILCWIDI